MADAFISYSHNDSDFGHRLHNSLLDQKRDIWMDWTSIPSTAKWWQEITVGIEAADNFVALISMSSMSSPVCQLEIEYARRNNKRIVPILVETTHERTAFVDLVTVELTEFQRTLIGERDLLAIARDNWQTLAGLNWIIFENADFDIKLSALIAALDLDLEYVHLHTRLLLRTKDWEQRGSVPGLLL